LSFAPTLLYIFKRDVCRHAPSDTANRGFHPIRIRKGIAGQIKNGKQAVYVDPVGRAVVVAKAAFHFFAGEGQTFNQSTLHRVPDLRAGNGVRPAVGAGMGRLRMKTMRSRMGSRMA